MCDLLPEDALPEIMVVQNAEYSGEGHQQHKLLLALLVGESPDKQLVIRKPLFEQIDTFITNAMALKSQYEQKGKQPPENIIKLLQEHNASTAFKELHKWQKEMLKSESDICESSHNSLLTQLLGDLEHYDA